MDWPYEESSRERKPRDFWKDWRTVAILQCFKQGYLSEDQATGILRTQGPNHLDTDRRSDVRWYVETYDREGWPSPLPTG